MAGRTSCEGAFEGAMRGRVGDGVSGEIRGLRLGGHVRS